MINPLSKKLILVFGGICAWVAPCRAEFPDRPADGEFFHDLAGIVDASSAEAIRDLQQSVYGEHGVPIVVVTIRRMSDYAPGTSIRGFAMQWFDSWGIGSVEKNDGILVLVSSEDREARIELGADWGQRYDSFSKGLMDRKMVPEFKKGNYGAGLRAAVASLAEVAAAGPQAEPPEAELMDRILDHPLMVFNRENNPISKIDGGSLIILVMALVGAGCVIAGIFVPAHRKPLLIAGFALIALALFFWIVVIVIGIFAKARGGGVSGGGSSGFSGGFSGGGELPEVGDLVLR